MKERPISFKGEMVRAILEGRKTMTRRMVNPGRGQEWLTPAVINGVKRFATSKDDWWTMAMGAPSTITHCGLEMDGGHIGSVRCPYGKAGDRLWVRETWATVQIVYDWEVTHCVDEVIDLKGRKPECDRGGYPASPRKDRIVYRADHGGDYEDARERSFCWRPSIHMPRWASRLTLEITNVRVERLQDITEADALAEGVTIPACDCEYPLEGHGCCDCQNSGLLGNPRQVFRELWESINGPGSWDANPWVWVVEFEVAK